MRRRLWLFLTLSLVLVAVALVSVRPLGGSTDVASAHVNTGTTHIEIDMVKEGGTEWCNPVTTSANHTTETYQVAICLSDSTASPGAFNIELNYDSALNQCADVDNANDPLGLDRNPDANQGTSSFTTPTLGTGCDCASGGVQLPTCDYWPGPPEGAGPSIRTAYVSCVCSVTQTLPAGSGISAPLALVTFHALGFNGDDALGFGTVAVYKVGGSLVDCGNTPANCIGAVDHKTGGEVPTTTPQPPTPTGTSTPSCGRAGQPACPTSTPTSRAWTKTPSPGPSATPGGEEPTSAPPPPPPPPPPSGGQQPSVTPPNTGTGSGGNAWMHMLMFLFGSGAALSLAFGGRLYLRRVKNR